MRKPGFAVCQHVAEQAGFIDPYKPSLYVNSMYISSLHAG